MNVVERKPVPIYEVICTECESKIQYMKSEVYIAHITCPVCGVRVRADAITPVKYDDWPKRVLE